MVEPEERIIGGGVNVAYLRDCVSLWATIGTYESSMTKERRVWMELRVWRTKEYVHHHQQSDVLDHVD